MGNDGGSIPKRTDLVKSKGKPQGTGADPRDADKPRWRQCALSNDPLRRPIVSCPLGRLFNKDALIALLLASPDDPPPFGAEGQSVAGHIRSLKDVTELKLHDNPALADSDEAAAPFVCPVTLREMNGSTKFMYRIPSGTVVSEVALRQIRPAQDSTAAEPADTAVDPVSGIRDPDGAQPEQWATIYPRGDDEKRAKEAWQAKVAHDRELKLLKKANKKNSKKRAGADNATAAADEMAAKRSKVVAEARSNHAGDVARSMPALSSDVSAKLAASREKQVNSNLASLYAPKVAAKPRFV